MPFQQGELQEREMLFPLEGRLQRFLRGEELLFGYLERRERYFLD